MFLLRACVPQVYENAKLLVCCADSLFGLDVRSGCVVLSSLQVPPHFFTQKSALSTSAMHAFLCHETNFFCVSTTSGLLHDVFQFVSVHPIPIEICYGLLRYALTFLLGMSGRRHLRRPLCLCAWTQQGVSFHPLWSLCLMFLLRACVPQSCFTWH